MKTMVKKLNSIGLETSIDISDIKKSDVVYSTTNLGKLSLMEKGKNRPVNLDHVKKLKKSIEKDYLRTVILVNEKLKIIDGQHRWMALSEINKEREKEGLSPLILEFVICPGQDIKESCKYNSISKNWSLKNIADGGIKMGINEYKVYDEFKNKYNLPHNVTMGLLTNEVTNSKNCDDFKNFELKIVDIKTSNKNAQKILDIVNTGIIPIGKSDQPISVFCLALLDIILNVKDYDHNRMVTNCLNYVKEHDKSLRRVTNITEPLIEFENIYNSKGRKKGVFLTESRKMNYMFKQMRNN